MILTCFALLLLVQGHAVFELDPARTQINFTLSDILHTVHGTFQAKRGTVEFDPATGAASGAIVIDAASGVSGNKGRDQKMHRDILQSDRYREITFEPKRLLGQVAPQGTSQVQIQGAFTLHGMTRPMTIAAAVDAAGDNLTVTMRFPVAYTQWGVKNPSTFILRVSDKVDIDVRATGRLAPQ